MFQSKAIQFKDRKTSWYVGTKFYGWWVETHAYDYWHRFTWKFIENPIYQVKRLYEWYVNVFQYDYDFDGHCLFAIIEYKLKRILPVLERGHSIQDPKDMKALKLAIKLAGRLKEDKYDEVGWNRVDKKFGEMKTWLTPIEGSTNKLWNSSRPKVNNEEEKKAELDYRLLQYAASENKMKREERWLYSILSKHLRLWWD